MNDSRFEWKVGLFVFGGVALLALLILNFSRGVTMFNPTYKLHVIVPNAAGLKPTADVMMAGYVIGKVINMDLARDEKSVDVTVSILSKYPIRKDSKFRVDALGFLGDQYIAVSAPADLPPGLASETAFFQDGDTVHAEAEFNMLDAEKSLTGMVNEAHTVINHLDQAITNVNQSALSRESLSHFVRAVSNLEAVSGQAVGAMRKVDNLLAVNSPTFTRSLSNFQAFSAGLTNSENELNHIITDNRGDIHEAVTNLTLASQHIRMITDDLQSGKGPAGALLKDPQVAAQIKSLVSNADNLTEEFSEFGHNLNKKGIWAMLWKPKRANTNNAPGR